MKLDRIAPLIREHKITGPVLLSMNKADLDDLCGPVISTREGPLPPLAVAFGDRVFLLEALAFIQAKEERVDKEKTIWSVKVPQGGPQYYNNCCECLAYTLCPCVVRFEHYKLKSNGMEVIRRPNRKTINVFAGVFTDFKDFRFLKKVDRMTNPCIPLCCWKRNGISLVFYAGKHESAKPRKDRGGDQDTMVIYHPDMTERAEASIRNSWAGLRLASMPGSS
jgi:hypothetical protein